MNRSAITVGIYSVSSQSGMTYFADLIERGYNVIGYARRSEHGAAVVSEINRTGGVWVERPGNQNDEASRFVPLRTSTATHDVKVLVDSSDIIIVAIPAHFHQTVTVDLAEHGLNGKRIPIVLSPSRTLAVPYIWNVLGEGHPVVSFATSPYSCKMLGTNSVYLKRRKRTWLASLEGRFSTSVTQVVRELFPQAALSTIPALTSLTNIGAVFHPAAFLLNVSEITNRADAGKPFSFYVEGIHNRPEVAGVIEDIDQVRLTIAKRIGLNVFGLRSEPRDDVWRKLTNGLRALEDEHEDDIDVLRETRAKFTEYLDRSVLSAQHWLDMTYGVERREGETLGDAIGRTPTYQDRSFPQSRYIEEDVPTGLVPFEAMARRLDIDCSVITDIIDQCIGRYRTDWRKLGRNLAEFTDEYLLAHLRGEAGRTTECGSRSLSSSTTADGGRARAVAVPTGEVPNPEHVKRGR